MPPTLSVTQLSTLAVLREMGYDAPRATAVLLKVGGSLNRALSALAEAPAPASAAASADAPSPRPSAKKAKKRPPKASPAAARATPAKAPPAAAARDVAVGAELRVAKEPATRGVCRRVFEKGNGHVYVDLATTAGAVVSLRRAQVEPATLTAAEAAACAAPAAAGEAVAAPAGAAAPADPAGAARESLPPKKRRRKGPPSPRDAGSPSALRAFDALRELHPDFDGTRAFPRNRTIMPTFKLRNCDNLEIPNEAHEAFEQFVICWLFNEVVPLYCHAPNRREATDDGPVPTACRCAPPPGLERLRVLELGGGIGAVSTMIQQMIEMLDPGAPHVVFEPNGALADGPLAHNRDRYRSTFAVLQGVLSEKDAVPFGSGDVDPNHPRAWMWGTVNGAGRSRGTVRGFGLDTVHALLGGAPSVLVADCEGGLIPALREFPQLLDSVKCVYYERDPPGDYEPMEELLRARGFANVLKASLHRVWVHEASLPPGAGGARGRAESLASAGSAASPRSPAAPVDAAAAALRVAAHRADLAVAAARAADRVRDLERLVDAGLDLARRAEATVPLDGPGLADATRRHFRDAYAPALARARELWDVARRAADAGAPARPRRLAINARVVCSWHEDDWPDGEVEWYPGLVSDAKEDGTYAILFDDEDERYGVPRDELRPIFVAGSFDWTHPFVQPDAAETQSSVDDRANSPAPEAIPEES